MVRCVPLLYRAHANWSVGKLERVKVTGRTCSATSAPPTVTLASVGPVPKPDRPPSELKARCGLAFALFSLSASPAGGDGSSADRQPVDLPPCEARVTNGDGEREVGNGGWGEGTH